MMKINILKLLAEAGATVSMSQGRREVVMGAVILKTEDAVDRITNFVDPVEVNVGDIIMVGQHTSIDVTQELIDKSQ